MSAPKRTRHQRGIRQALRGHTGIKWELDRLEKTANAQIRKTLPRFRYNGEVTEALLQDLAEVVEVTTGVLSLSDAQIGSDAPRNRFETPSV